jgi:hypothetical protein
MPVLPEVPSMIVRRLEQGARALGVLDHRDRHPVLDRVARLKVSNLASTVAFSHEAGVNAIEPEPWRVAEWNRARYSQIFFTN